MDRFHSTTRDAALRTSWALPLMLDRATGALRRLGRQCINAIWRLGYASRFFTAVLMRSGTSFSRFRLVIKEIYFAGVLSLIIIIVSGLFVGMVLGLQGYETLQRYGSAEAVGTLVALGFATAACGQKGPLFLPEDRAATEVQAPAPASTPATEETKKKEEPR